MFDYYIAMTEDKDNPDLLGGNCGGGGCGAQNSNNRGSGNKNKDSNSDNNLINHNENYHHQDPFGDVCRDFLRNVCRRGNNCRYRHPDANEAEELGKKIEYIFCHDYQNRECRRQNCRFLHCTKQEEEVYRSSGKLPPHVVEKMAHQKASDMGMLGLMGLGNSGIGGPCSGGAPGGMMKPGGDPIPVCKDFLKGECRRGAGRCKFRHISQADYEMEMRQGGANGNPANLAAAVAAANASANAASAAAANAAAANMRYSNHSRANIGPNSSYNNDRGYDNYAPPEPKRRAYDTGAGYSSTFPYGADRGGVPGLASMAGGGPGPLDYDYCPPGLGSAAAAASAMPHQPPLYNNTRFLEEENAALRRRIDELKKQVADLMATNEFLLDQNAQLRTLGKTVPSSASQASLPTAAGPVPPLGPPPLPPITSDLLGQQTVVPASLASLGAGGGIPVSSMAALSTSVISTSSAPLVSYPIMTAAIKSLRPPTIPHSLSH